MIRRLRLTAVGLGVFLLPACTGTNQLSDPRYTGGGPGYVLMNRPGTPPNLYQRQTPQKAVNGANSKDPAMDQRFGPAVPPDRPNQNLEQAQHRQPDPKVIEPPGPKNSPLAEQQAKFDQPVGIESPLSDPKQWPRIAVAPGDRPGDVELQKNVIAPQWPNFGSKSPESQPTKSPGLLPPLDSPPPTIETPMNLVPPPIDPIVPKPSGMSMKVGESGVSIEAAAAMTSDETTLVRVMKAFQNNRPEEAVGLLKRLDPTNQELVLNLMPMMVRLGEGNLSAMTPDELAMLIERLQSATSMLKSKASLRIDRAFFCRGVRKFADVDPYEARHEFRPGDMVFLYAELKNFTCEPVNNVASSSATATNHKGYNIRLGASLEMRDTRNGLVWRTDLSKNDFAQTPPHDYYHTYRFCIPERLPPGAYTLWLTVIDKPTNRAIRKPIELRVGQG